MPFPIPFYLVAGLALGIGAAVYANKDEIKAFMEKRRLIRQLQRNSKTQSAPVDPRSQYRKAPVAFDAQDLEFIYVYLLHGHPLPPHIRETDVRNHFVVVDRRLYRVKDTSLDCIDHLRFAAVSPPKYENDIPMGEMPDVRRRRGIDGGRGDHGERRDSYDTSDGLSFSQYPGRSVPYYSSGVTSSANHSASTATAYANPFVLSEDESDLTPPEDGAAGQPPHIVLNRRRGSLESETFSAYNRRTAREYGNGPELALCSDTSSVACSEYVMARIDTPSQCSSWVDAPSLSHESGLDTPSVAASLETDIETDEEDSRQLRDRLIINDNLMPQR